MSEFRPVVDDEAIASVIARTLRICQDFTASHGVGEHVTNSVRGLAGDVFCDFPFDILFRVADPADRAGNGCLRPRIGRPFDRHVALRAFDVMSCHDVHPLLKGEMG